MRGAHNPSISDHILKFPVTAKNRPPVLAVRTTCETAGLPSGDLLQHFFGTWAAWDGGEPELLSPPPLHRRHAAWAVLTVRPAEGEAFEETQGRFRGRVHALLTALEDAGTTDAHAWPRPFETGPASARYAIGLGHNPPDPTRLAEITEWWSEGLPGVKVDMAESGGIPTLC